MKPLPRPRKPSNAPLGEPPLLLLCNDDGFFREEIRILHRRLRGLGHPVIVAPDRERSAASLAVTLRQPLRLQRHAPSVWSVDGTPADCIYFALRKVLPRRPDLLISGMNPGPNLGQQDVHYSGTVAAAIQGAFLGLRAMAVSISASRPPWSAISPPGFWPTGCRMGSS
jgi:5'-nucleotidase